MTRRWSGRAQRVPAQGRARAELVHAVRVVVAAGEALLAPSVTRRLIADSPHALPRRGPVFRARTGSRS